MFEADETPQVLIADDDEAMRLLLRTAVSQWGYSVVEASNGEEAWEILQRKNPPRLLILDWRMPKMDGLALCERVRKELRFYPYIIFLSQVSGAANIIRGLDAGADEFLLKPVNFEELRTRLFAGERIMKFLKIIDQQKQQLHNCNDYIKTLESLLVLQWSNVCEEKTSH